MTRDRQDSTRQDDWAARLSPSFGSRSTGAAGFAQLRRAAIFAKRKVAYRITLLLLRHWDRAHNVDTGGWLRLDPVPGVAFKGGYDVVSTPPSVFRFVARFFPASRGNSTYIDVGSGKGRTVLLASELGFKAAIGVDLAGFACEVARRNLVSFRSATRPRSPCEIINADATQYDLPAGDLVLFFNNPFGADVWPAMAEKIGAACSAQRRITIALIGSFPDTIRVGASLIEQASPLRIKARGMMPRSLDAYARFHYIVLEDPCRDEAG